MAAGAFIITFLSLVLSDAAPIDTQLQNLHHQVKSLNNVLDDVIREFVDLRQKHEDLEHKFHDVSVELNHVRRKQDRRGRRKNRNLGGLSEERSAFSQRSGTVFKPTFSLLNNWKGHGPQSGNVGLKGEKGDPGLTGPKGDAGIAGPKGASGLTGPKGDDGIVGPKGASGLTGPKGDDGIVGPKGASGLTGPKGADGIVGPKGDTGPIGPRGVAGLNGSKGATGSMGPKGDTGSTGPQGYIGLTGPKGNTGNPGTQGTSGSKGQRGNVGLKGEPGVNAVQHKIAFHAKLGSNMGGLSDNQHINMQDDVFTVGAGYDRHTGVFVSPIDGVYLFSITVLVLERDQVEVAIMKNGDTIVDVYTGAEDELQSGSNMALVHLQANDRVWVQVDKSYHAPNSVIDNHFTTFTGLLLYT
ncbi:complement C1q and tumor necrosis factor-related protein 9-like [Pecten maximus]|uniref:complement C1q and tumor necrosis factor-related protein 9-like n=1 Tax=Pecten maximus TaxID=6579 RepID=UPI0014581FA2|nr:complement C1q and tumor necrosis factor-related protein 9-like [Pecten maximus]